MVTVVVLVADVVFFRTLVVTVVVIVAVRRVVPCRTEQHEKANLCIAGPARLGTSSC